MKQRGYFEEARATFVEDEEAMHNESVTLPQQKVFAAAKVKVACVVGAGEGGESDGSEGSDDDWLNTMSGDEEDGAGEEVRGSDVASGLGVVRLTECVPVETERMVVNGALMRWCTAQTVRFVRSGANSAEALASHSDVTDVETVGDDWEFFKKGLAQLKDKPKSKAKEAASSGKEATAARHTQYTFPTVDSVHTPSRRTTALTSLINARLPSLNESLALTPSQYIHQLTTLLSTFDLSRTLPSFSTAQWHLIALTLLAVLPSHPISVSPDNPLLTTHLDHIGCDYDFFCVLLANFDTDL